MATAASGDWAWMAEVAGEELAKLEAAHPARFGPLKAELQRLVADPGLDAAVFPPLDQCMDAALLPRAGDAPSSRQAAPPPPLLCTQESSTQKRKPAGGASDRKDGKRRRSAATAPPPGGTKDRAEMAIERAERCLERIRDIKRELARRFDPFIVIEEKGVDKVP